MNNVLGLGLGLDLPQSKRLKYFLVVRMDRTVLQNCKLYLQSHENYGFTFKDSKAASYALETSAPSTSAAIAAA